MPVMKRKRVSKKKKISWRKHVNIEDVENFLEDQRFEERLGKPVSEKTDNELFVVENDPKKVPLSSKQKRRILLQQSLPKCFSMLQPHSEVPDPVVKRNRVRTKEERRNLLVKLKEQYRKERGILGARELQSQKDRSSYEIKKAAKPKHTEFDKDIWTAVDDSKNKELDGEWINSITKTHNLRNTGKYIKAIPKSITSKPTALPAITPPHPGTSYNPSFEDHQALLQELAEKEAKIIKEEKHLARVTRGFFSRVTAEQKEKSWLEEMSQGLEKVTDDATEEGHYEAVNPPVENKKKDLKKRRKQREQRQLEVARQRAKKEKKKVADIYKLRFLKAQLEQQAKKEEILRLKRQKKEELDKDKPKRLSALKFEEQDIDCSMPQDIPGNLRNVRKEGSLLLDSFKSLQRRSILQPTIKRTRARAKVKKFVKAGHKDDWKVTVARPNNSW